MKPLGVILHLTASTYGDAAEVDKWHKQNGWKGIGYHRLIQNGRRKSSSGYNAAHDGVVENGRADHLQGAHCLAGEMNRCTFGICSVGEPGVIPSGASSAPSELIKSKYLTARQAEVLTDLVARLCLQKGWDPDGTFTHPTTQKTIPVITQHSDHDPGSKPHCASLNMEAVRAAVGRRMKAIMSGEALEAEAFESEFEMVDQLDDVEESGIEPESDVPPAEADSHSSGPLKQR